MSQPPDHALRRLVRALGLGKISLRMRRFARFGARVEWATFLAKRRYLRRIQDAPPLSASRGGVEVVMLLNEPRFWEGMWALYSFRFFFGECRVLVLNDGTLSKQSIERLLHTFPGIRVPGFLENDQLTRKYLDELGLLRCREWRERFVFFRKLIDPLRLAVAPGVILLDSDVLHFRAPAEVQLWSKHPEHFLHIGDVEKYSYCARPDILRELAGGVLPEYFCAGYLCVPVSQVSLRRVEGYLKAECFDRQRASGKFSHVAEQTLYAMEAGVTGCAVLPPSYGTCPDLAEGPSTAGHFCGGSFLRTWFYTEGIPRLAQVLGLAGREEGVKRMDSMIRESDCG